MESLLKQERADEVERFLGGINPGLVSSSEFSLYSIGVILSRMNEEKLLKDFIWDIFDHSGVNQIVLSTDQLKNILDKKKEYNLDFDDGYQYVASKFHDLTLVSFDKDFDKTDIERKTPAQILEELKI